VPEDEASKFLHTAVPSEALFTSQRAASCSSGTASGPGVATDQLQLLSSVRPPKRLRTFMNDADFVPFFSVRETREALLP